MSILPNLPSGAGAASFNKGGFDAKPEEGTCWNNARERRASAKEKFQPKPDPVRIPITDSDRERVFVRDGGACLLCGATAADGAKLEVDHVMPVAQDGAHNESNWATLCKKCNGGKRARRLFLLELIMKRHRENREGTPEQKAGALPPPVDPPPLTPEQQSENYDWRNRMDQSPKLHAVLARGQKDKHHEQAKTAKGKVPAHEQGRAAQGRGVLDAQRPADDVEAGSDADGGECAEGASG